uniref:Uncharacterized protein n=1 Tax=Glossina pallidipes TaxID=7398 RepID=A0A1B0AE33_GLOPL
MSIKSPTTSVTAELYTHLTSSDDSDYSLSSTSSSNEMDYNRNWGGRLTDVEDVESQADMEEAKAFTSTLTLPLKGDGTDIEDYNDSDSEDDDRKSCGYPELQTSLQEFLQHNIQQNLSVNNETKEHTELKSGNFLRAQCLNNSSDYLTDNEEYNTESDLEDNYEASVCYDLDTVFAEQGRLNIADATEPENDRKNSEDTYEEVSVLSDISDMASACSNVTDAEIQGLSENEFLEMSDNEEVCQIACSDTESEKASINKSDSILHNNNVSPIDVAFLTPTESTINNPQRKYSLTKTVIKKHNNNNNLFLQVSGYNEDVLTDTERLDDSSAGEDSFGDDEDNEQPIPQAVIQAAGDVGICQTDCEDFDCDDLCSASTSMDALAIDINTLPPPERELVVLHENNYGDTIASVMPMENEFHFGLGNNTKDECLTDSEDYSCAENIDIHCSPVDHTVGTNELIEGEITIENESLKAQQTKRIELHANVESPTDIEEIYVAGTNTRRKKLRARTMSKGKSKTLEAPKVYDDGSTEVEDIDDVDFNSYGPRQTTPDGIPTIQTDSTQIEELTADDDSPVSDTEARNADANNTSCYVYPCSSGNVLITEDAGMSHLSKKSLRKQSKNKLTQSYQQQTDDEDVQLQSDDEEGKEEKSTIAVSVYKELNDMLNESYTTVHEKCSNNFDVDAERMHIKGMIREAYTDSEYIESDESAAKNSK